MDEKFRKLIVKTCDNASLGAIFSMLMLIGLTLFFLFAGLQITFFLILALGTGIGAYYISQRFKGDFKGGKYWATMIKDRPENIVWIKPIVTRHTVGYVFTLYKEKKFQFLTKDRLAITMTVDSEADQKIFYEGIIKHLPHAHIGYSPDMDSLYRYSPADLIDELKKTGEYYPVGGFSV